MKVLLAVAALIAYGSLYPFEFAAPHDIGAAFRDLFDNVGLWTSRGDVLGNIGLFVPFGLVGVYTPHGWARRRAVLWTVGSGLLLAFLLQVAQIWVPSRSAVLADVFWNGVGLACGIIGAVVATALPKPRVSVDRTFLPAVTLLGLWIVAELAPLVPSIDLAGFRSSLRFLRTSPDVDAMQAFHVAVQVVLAGRLMAGLSTVRSSILWLVGAVAAVLAGKVLVVSLALDWTTVVGLIGGVLGWAALAVRDVLPHRTVLAALLAGSYVLYALAPFEGRSAGLFHWIPFASVLEGGMLSNVRSLASTAFLLGGLLWLLRRPSLPIATAVVATGALALEIAQVWIAGRTAGSTEPVVALVAGWALAQVQVEAEEVGDVA